ncbi:DNA-directed RNA polymerase I subunit RPA34 [Dromaius novaehollandiae]|uniref:DNA-directed RNA polymerase I subunit RPA34 n=1 Tax=Dromaius novaehollandiae TaxID=8790 RepID=UPI00311EBFB9
MADAPPAEPQRFRCPPGFAAAPPSPPPGPWDEALGRPGTELWLIRAPADFPPESLEGCAVPLGGCGGLRGAGRRWGVRGGPGGAGGARLLVPCARSGRLACAPPLRGTLALAETFGPPAPPPGPEPEPPPPAAGRKKRRERRKEPAPPREPDAEGGPEPEPEPEPPEPETPEPPKKKKKKHKRRREATEDGGQTEPL